MTATTDQDKSLDQLERQAEQKRALLSDTVDELRDRVQDEANELRERISPAHIKAEVGQYIRGTGQAWRDTLEERARANPLQSAAVAVGLAYPIWKIFRNIPAPLLLVGAGIALAQKTSKNSMGGSQSVGSGLLSTASDHLQDAKDGVSSAVSSVTNHATETVRQGFDKASSVFGTAGPLSTENITSNLADQYKAASDATSRYASAASDRMTETLRDGTTALSDTQERSKSLAVDASRTAVSFFENNPLLVAGAGMVLGAIIAAAIPSTELESRILEETVPDLKQKAGSLIDEGYQMASEAVGSAYEKATEHARDNGLTPEAAQTALKGLGEKVSSVADAAVGGYAGSESRTPNNTSAATQEKKYDR